jgi:hypothetical protein
MDSYFNKKFWTGFTGLFGFFYSRFPEETGKISSASRREVNVKPLL